MHIFFAARAFRFNLNSAWALIFIYLTQAFFHFMRPDSKPCKAIFTVLCVCGGGRLGNVFLSGYKATNTRRVRKIFFLSNYLIIIWLLWGARSIILGLVFIFLGVMLRKISTISRELIAPLECGFSSEADRRQPVSLRFFIYAVVFVVFDVELVLIVPLIYNFPTILRAIWIFFVVLNLLRLGLLFEWNNTAFEWLK